jgi:hypothetical protein
MKKAVVRTAAPDLATEPDPFGIWSSKLNTPLPLSVGWYFYSGKASQTNWPFLAGNRQQEILKVSENTFFHVLILLHNGLVRRTVNIEKLEKYRSWTKSLNNIHNALHRHKSRGLWRIEIGEGGGWGMLLEKLPGVVRTMLFPLHSSYNGTDTLQTRKPWANYLWIHFIIILISLIRSYYPSLSVVVFFSVCPMCHTSKSFNHPWHSQQNILQEDHK